MGESRDEKSFKISLEFLFGLNAALFLTLLFVALFVFNDLDGDDASTAGGAFGTASAVSNYICFAFPYLNFYLLLDVCHCCYNLA